MKISIWLESGCAIAQPAHWLPPPLAHLETQQMSSEELEQVLNEINLVTHDNNIIQQ